VWARVPPRNCLGGDTQLGPNFIASRNGSIKELRAQKVLHNRCLYPSVFIPENVFFFFIVLNETFARTLFSCCEKTVEILTLFIAAQHVKSEGETAVVHRNRRNNVKSPEKCTRVKL